MNTITTMLTTTATFSEDGLKRYLLRKAWAVKHGDFVSALYLMNDDFAVMVFAPITAAPQTILDEMED